MGRTARDRRRGDEDEGGEGESRTLAAEAARRGYDLYARLRARLLERGYSAADIAEQTGIRASSLSAWNTRSAPAGSKGPSYGELALIAELIGVDLRELIGPDPAAARPDPLATFEAELNGAARDFLQAVTQAQKAADELERQVRRDATVAGKTDQDAAGKPDIEWTGETLADREADAPKPRPKRRGGANGTA